MAVLTPWAASFSAIPLPIPRELPVISAVLPRSGIGRPPSETGFNAIECRHCTARTRECPQTGAQISSKTLRRQDPGSSRVQARRFYDFGPFRLDVNRRVLLRNGARVSLTGKAFDTLLALVERQGELVEKDDLIEQLWPD